MVSLADLSAPTSTILWVSPWLGCPLAPWLPHASALALSLRKLADCAQLLEVDDMVRLAVPDSKCVYTYIQELYRSLVQKGLVKTKKK